MHVRELAEAYANLAEKRQRLQEMRQVLEAARLERHRPAGRSPQAHVSRRVWIPAQLLAAGY
jgi:hypothetical protein